MTKQRALTAEDLAANPLLVSLGAEVGWVASLTEGEGEVTDDDLTNNPIIKELEGRAGDKLSVRKSDEIKTAEEEEAGNSK